MKWLLGTYTDRFNRRHKLFGHLLSGRYEALVVDHGGGIEAGRVDGAGPEASTEGRREEGAYCAAVAGGDDNDAEMDRGGVADGCLDARVWSGNWLDSGSDPATMDGNCER